MAYVVSSSVPDCTYPAFAARKSIFPYMSIAFCIASLTSPSGLFWSSSRTAAPLLLILSNRPREREVAITLSPAERAFTAKVSPNPPEAPVMSQTLLELDIEVA